MALTAQVVAAQSTLHNSIASGLSHWNANLAQKHALNLHVNTKNLSQPLGRISGDLKQFESALAASNARVIAFGASTAVLGGVAKTFKEIAVATIEVEKTLTDVNRVFGLSSEGLKNFSRDLFNISKQTASAFSEVSTAALEFSRQGLGTEETLRRVNDALILVRLTGVSTTQAVEDLTAVVNAYSDAALNTTEVLNKIVAVEQQFAVSAADLTVAVSRTGQAAQEAGVNFDKLNALVTAVQERTARGGAVIGNALKTIFTRLGRSDTLDQLERFNIAVRDVEGNVLPAVDILQNLATSYKTLSDTTRASLSEQVAGVYQVNILKSLLSDLADNQGVYNKAVSIGEKATNEATLANEKLNKTLSALISQTGTALLQLGNNIGKTTFEPVFRFLVEPFNEAIVYINDLLEGEGIGSDFANGLLKGIRNVISGPGLVLSMAVVFKVVYNTLRDVTKALPAVLGITTAAQKTLQVQESILGILQSESDAQRALYGLYGNKNAAAELALQIAQAQTAEYKEQVAYATELAALAVKKGVVVSPDIGLSVKTKSSGYIPNFSSGGIPSNVRSKEIRGALNGGYTPGSVIAAPKSIGGVMNSAEKVKYVPGFAQPFINPPRNSKAGMLHQQRAISSVGVDPYSGSGYIPNFAANQYTYVGNTPLMNPSGRVIKKGDVLKKAEMSGFTRLLVGKADLENFDKDDVLKVRSLFRPVGDTPEYTIAGKAGLATAELKPVSSAVPRSNDEEPDVLGKPIPSKINTPAEINAASIVAFMGKSLTDDEAWRVGKKALKDVDNIQGISEEKRKELKSAIEKEMAPIKRAFGAEYEAFAMNELRKLGFSSIQTAESLKLYGWDRGQTAVDAVDMKTKTFFEFKGGEFKTKDGGKDDVNSKFKRVRMNPGNFDILTGHQWKNVLVSNKYNEGARPGNKTIYLNPSQHSGPRQYLKERVQTPTGTETKTFGPVPITGSIMDEIFAEADRTKKTFKGNLFSGYIPNFAYNLKKVGSGIGELSVSTNQENAGMLMGEYAQAFAQAKKMNLQTIRGKLVRQKRQPRDPNDPVSIIKADIPQIIRGRFGNSSSLHLAGQAFHFNSRTFDADLSSQAASLAALLTKSPHTNIELYTDLFKSKGKGSSKLSGGTLDYEARKKALLGMSGGYIPNFAYKNEVMGLEEGLSGNKAIYSSSPFPHIRNTSQPTFSSAIADHGGLNNALKDSFANQSMAGLVSKGFVPNFADFDITGTPLSGPKGQIVSFKKINAAINSYVQNSDLVSKNNFVLNSELQKVIGQLGLSKQSFEAVRKASLEFAKGQKKIIVDAANKVAETARNLQQQTAAATEKLAKITREVEVEKLKELEREKASRARTDALQKEFIAASQDNTVAIVKTEKETVETTKTQSKFRTSLSKVGEKLSKFGTPLSLALPFIAGQAEQGLFEGRQRSDLSQKERFGQSFLSTGISSVSTGALVGSFFPGWGTAIGAAVGGLVALNSAFGAMKKTTSELAEELDQQKQKNQQNVSAAEKYVEIQKQLFNGFGSGMTSSDMELANKSLTKTFNEIKDVRLQDAFLSTKGNIIDLNQQLKEYADEVGRQGAFTDFIRSKNPKDAASSLFASLDSPEQTQKILGILLKTQIAKSSARAIRGQLEGRAFESEGGKSRVDEIRTATSKEIDLAADINKNIQSILIAKGITRDNPNFEIFTEQLRKSFTNEEDLSKLITEYQALIEKNKALANKLKEQEKKNYNLYQERAKLSLEFNQIAANVNSKLKSNEATRKLEEGLFNFQTALAESFTSPLKIIASKFSMQKKRLEEELTDSITKINSDFADSVYGEFEKSGINDKESRDRGAEAIRATRGGDFTKLKALTQDQSFFGEAPAFAESLNKSLQRREIAIAEAKQNTAEQIKQTQQASDLETIKTNNLLSYSEILRREEGILASRELLDMRRKTSNELDIDEIQRQSDDPANFLGRGVQGKAEERNKYRSLLLEKKLKDSETNRMRSMEVEYSKVLDIQRKMLYDSAQSAESNRDLERAVELRKKAQSITVAELKTQEDLAKVTKDAELISFENVENEKTRLDFIRNSTKAQQEFLSEKEKEEKLLARINAEELRRAKRSRSFSYGLSEGFDEIQDEVDTFENRLGKSLPGTFKNGIVGALDAAINKTDDLGNALMDVASAFLRTIQNAMFEQIAGTMVSGIGASFKKQKGGIIRAQNGMYISGGRTGDKNPAMLEDGEYVLNRQAVKALGGPRVLNDLNFNQFPRFANGGSTSASANMTVPFSNLSEFGKENNPEYGAYVDSLREKEAIKEAKKAKEKALINQLVATAITSAVTIGYSAGSKSVAANSANRKSGMTTPQTPARGFDANPNGQQAYVQRGGLLSFNSGGYLPYGNRLNDSIPALLGGGEYIVNNRAVRKYGVGGLNRINSGVAKFQDGGMVGSSGIANAGNTESSSANNISINITVNSSNGKTNSEQTNISGARNEDGNALLAGKIKEVVLQVIASEQRTGGVLDSTKKK